MQNEALLDHVKTIQHLEGKVESLRQAGIVTYARLLSLLGDSTTETELRIELCQILGFLHQYVDKRRVVRPLIAALNSNLPDLSFAAATAIGILGLKRTIPHLGKLATDKNQPNGTRVLAIQALGSMRDPRALAVLRGIVADNTDDLGIRAEALEQTAWCVIDEASLQYYIDLLSDISADLRFWAAYCLGQISQYMDISPALDALDRVVAFDHTLPAYWGWHVDREALLPFEIAYFRSLNHDQDKTPTTWIISPAAEFMRFIREYRRWTESWVYTTDPSPVITLQLDKSWFIAQLQQRWPSLSLDVRQPKPQAYLVDFQLTLNGEILIGGLHRDGYTLVLTGDREAVFEFAAWYRGLFAPDQSLFLYQWAEPGINLKHNITAQDIFHLTIQRELELSRGYNWMLEEPM